MRVDRKGAQLKTRSGGRPSLTLSFWVRFPLSRSSSSFFSSPPTLSCNFTDYVVLGLRSSSQAQFSDVFSPLVSIGIPLSLTCRLFSLCCISCHP